LERGEKGDFFVPLATSSAEEPVLLELRYTVPGGRRLDLPAFPEEPAVQKVYLCAFVPQTQALLGTLGPWNEEFQWQYAAGGWTAVNRTGDKALVAWVHEGVKDPGAAAESFHTDGTPYVFSTLRPPSDGSLVVRTMDHRWLSGLVFAVIVLGGLVLLPAGVARRVLAAGLLVVALVLSGVFAPTFSLQVLNGSLMAAVLIVLVLWTVVCVFRLREPAALFGQAVTARWAASRAAKSPPPAAEPGQGEGGPSHD
jgi:hypothetical protein